MSIICESVFRVKKLLYICNRLAETALLIDVMSEKMMSLNCKNAGIAQLVEHDLAKVGVASPSLVSRS
jgi:hypothetical protein